MYEQSNIEHTEKILLMGQVTYECVGFCLVAVVVGLLFSFLFYSLSLLLIVLPTSNLAKWPYFITRNFNSIFIFTHTHKYFLWRCIVCGRLMLIKWVLYCTPNDCCCCCCSVLAAKSNILYVSQCAYL